MSNVDVSAFSTGSLSMMRVAVSIKLRLRIFETNGKLRDARKLHSITFTSLFLARYWMLKGPEMLSSFAIVLLMRLMRRAVSIYIFWAGNTSVASPEWTPANSTCSEIAYSMTSPLRATASNSISLAFCKNSETTTGNSFDTFAAAPRNSYIDSWS